MAKVTVHTDESKPSPQAKSANQLVYVTDSKGRKLGLRELPFLEEFRIMEALGPELAKNTTYVGMINPLLYLAEIDGQPVHIPRSKVAIDALIQLAGREGFMAVMRGISEHFVVDEAALNEKIKNADGTPD
jgi:hypothetical protein